LIYEILAREVISNGYVPDSGITFASNAMANCALKRKAKKGGSGG
jgi:hypothetical protein